MMAKVLTMLDDPWPLYKIPFETAKTKKQNPSGEESGYLIDGPMTPQQYTENTNLYGPGISLRERLQVGLHRFSIRQSKNAKQDKQFFDRFIQFGGIQIAPVLFGGATKLDRAEMRELDPLLQARMLSNYDLPDDLNDAEKFTIDFLAIVRAYLGSIVNWEASPENAIKTCRAIINFYNYLLHHDILAEYNSDIIMARTLVENTAVEEIKMLYCASIMLPGNFNSACTQFLDGNSSDEERHAAVSVIKNHLAAFTDMHTSWAKAVDFLDKTSHMYHAETLTTQYQIEKCVTETGVLGKLICRPWTGNLSSHSSTDLPPHQKPEGHSRVELLVEKNILQHLKDGMKIKATIVRLQPTGAQDRPIWVLNSIESIYASYYEAVLNEYLPYGNVKSIKWRVGITALGKAEGDFERP